MNEVLVVRFFTGDEKSGVTWRPLCIAFCMKAGLVSQEILEKRQFWETVLGEILRILQLNIFEWRPLTNLVKPPDTSQPIVSP